MVPYSKIPAKRKKQIAAAKPGHRWEPTDRVRAASGGGPAASCHKDNAKGGVAECVGAFVPGMLFKDADA
jgi:hypothetical protein